MATKLKSIAPKRAPKLPEKLSDCLAVALGDLIKCERNKRTYRIDMGIFHEPNSHCTVCLAGAVMAQTLCVPPTQMADPYNTGFANHNKLRLCAISNCACSSLGAGIWYLQGHCGWRLAQDNGWLDKRTPRYDIDPKAFKSAIRGYIKELRKHGL